jgi:hypothetical protein
MFALKAAGENEARPKAASEIASIVQIKPNTKLMRYFVCSTLKSD